MMAVQKIVLYAENPAPLRQRSKPVKGVNRHTRKLIQDLKDTLNAHAEGIGLAAPQINVHFRLVLVRLNAGNEAGGEPDPPIALVNPQIIEAADEQLDFDGCLSFPGIYANTIRPHHLRVTGLDEDGKPFNRLFTGFDAVVVHHEIDHLNGVLFIDRVEKFEDLYQLREDENGRFHRVPIITSQGQSGAVFGRAASLGELHG
ncbi:MAG: peptide deformylase [Chloroflexota bacterium]